MKRTTYVWNFREGVFLWWGIILIFKSEMFGLALFAFTKLMQHFLGGLGEVREYGSLILRTRNYVSETLT